MFPIEAHKRANCHFWLWWDKKGSNLRRAGLQPAALPSELSSHIEPLCITNLSIGNALSCKLIEKEAMRHG